MSIKKFSDIPYYMIYDYFSELKSYYGVPDTSKDEIVRLYEAVTFEEPWIDFHFQEDFLDFGAFYNKRESDTTKIRLRGPRLNIITQGGEYTQFHAKIENYGYKPVWLRPITTENWVDENWLRFDKQGFEYLARGIFTKQETQEVIDSYGKAKALIVNQIPENIKPVGENIEYKDYCVIDHISTNDNELTNIFEENRGNILDNEIDITKSKPGKSHALKVWKKKRTEEEMPVEAEHEIYLRKDSFFFQWFQKNLKYLGDKLTDNGLKVLTEEEKEKSVHFPWNHEYYLNDNMLFNFIGCIWPMWAEDQKWKIFHRSLKDFMIEAIPYNDMGYNLKSFTWENFDRIYQEIYNMQKNIYTLLDPDEIYDRYLGFLALFYDVDLDKFQVIPSQNKRWYIKNLPYFLKKKGSWASLWISWQCIIDKDNDINFYERWHLRKKIQTGSVINLKQNEVIDV